MRLGRISLRSIILVFFCGVLFFSLWMSSPDFKKLVYRATKLGYHSEPMKADRANEHISEGEHIVNRASVKIEAVRETPSASSSLKGDSETKPPGSPGTVAESVGPAPVSLKSKTRGDSVKEAIPGDTTASLKRTYYSLHIGSFQNSANARKRVELLIKAGLDNVWCKRATIPGKGKWYRVYIGRHQDRAEALRLGKKLKAGGIIKEFFVHELTQTSGPGS
ncbi:MAG: SPOR domain-containing protein [Deltaproteobacteria bacterium]|nr:SPOR domain-containing protein [Deltaproteobacteria bacterium]MBW2342186.1 SPOR domain-containing protein [Deltaproteobacteria bacterium]